MFTTYFLHPAVGGCATRSQLSAAGPDFRNRIDAMAAATGNRPAVFLLEIDGVGSSRCMQKTGALSIWEADLKYEATKMGSLPHTVVYLEGGYSDGNPPGYTAKRAQRRRRAQHPRLLHQRHPHQLDDRRDPLGREGLCQTGGANFIVNTAQNGNGPLRPHNRVKNGNEVLCNPPGRAMGPPPTTTTGFAHADAFLWTGPPGNSSGHCHGGPNPGAFWPASGNRARLAGPGEARAGVPGRQVLAGSAASG